MYGISNYGKLHFMFNDSLLSSKLCALVENIAVPAALLSIDKHEVIASNNSLLSSYGSCFGEGIEFYCNCDFSLHSHFKIEFQSFRFMLEGVPEDVSDFECIQFSEGYALLVESHWKIDSKVKNNIHELSGHLASSDTYEPFNFSYMYRLSSGEWVCSSVDDLVDLFLLEKGKGMSDFCWRSLIVDDDLARYDKMISSVRTDGGNFEASYCIKNLKGEVIQVFDHCSRISPDGQWPVLVGSVFSSQKSFEEIQHAERQVLVGRLVGGMIHDFKNLLTGVQNIIEWCIAKSGDNSEVIDALHKTVSYTEQATNLISGALKVSSGEVETKKNCIDLGELVCDFEGLVRRIIPASTELLIEVEEGLPCLFGPRRILQDLILNLCVNAKDAMKNRGDSLAIRVSKVVGEDEFGDLEKSVVLSVTDSGEGMNQSQVKSIFEAFYSTKETGAGLGLWMVREAARTYGGSINVISSVGEGTTFEITFPVDENPQIEIDAIDERVECEIVPVATADVMKVTSGKKVLLIEDEPLIRSGVSAWLESWGIELLSAEDGIEGANLFLENRDSLDLVIQDYILPGKCGDELLVEFNSMNPDVPVIITSANPDRKKFDMVENGDAYAFLEKPFRMDKLQSMLQKVFA